MRRGCTLSKSDFVGLISKKKILILGRGRYNEENRINTVTEMINTKIPRTTSHQISLTATHRTLSVNSVETNTAAAGVKPKYRMHVSYEQQFG